MAVRYVLKIMTIILIVLIVTSSLLNCCDAIRLNKYRNRFNNEYKDEIISLVKENINELTQFINEIEDNNISYDISIKKKENVIIGKDKDANVEIKYNQELKDYIFNKFKLNYVYFDNMGKNLISFNIDDGTGTDTMFYYSKDNSDLYYWSEERLKSYNERNSKYIDIKEKNWRICLWISSYLYKKNNELFLTYNYKEGIYTEKIIDKWYYCEDTWDHFPSINYVVDDLKTMGRYDEVMSILSNDYWSDISYKDIGFESTLKD